MLTPVAEAASADRPPVVAVFDIDMRSKRFKKKFARQLTDQFRVKLAETKKMIIVDRSEQERELKQLLNESRKASYKACVDEACQIPLGKQLAANQLLRTRASRFGKTFVLSSELIDVATGGSSGAATVKTDGTEGGMLAAVELLAGKLTGTGPLEGGAGETVLVGSAGFEGLSTSGGEAGGKDGIVRFVSKPAGMKVWVNGRQLSGQTPLEDFLKLGKAKVKVGGSKQYKDYSSRLTLKKNMNVTVKLEPIVGDIVVVVRDSKGGLVRGMPVHLDGKKVAKAPVRLSRVLVGQHTIRTETPYGAEATNNVQVKDGADARVELVVLDKADHEKKIADAKKRKEEQERAERCRKAKDRVRSYWKQHDKMERKGPKYYCFRTALDDCRRAEANGGRVNCSGAQRQYDKCRNNTYKRWQKSLESKRKAVEDIKKKNKDCRF